MVAERYTRRYKITQNVHNIESHVNKQVCQTESTIMRVEVTVFSRSGR